MAGGRAEKTLAKMRVNPKGWRYAEVAQVLEAYGFELKSRRGSHCVFKHPLGCAPWLWTTALARYFRSM